MAIYKPIYEKKWFENMDKTRENVLEEIEGTRKDNITGQKHRFELSKEIEKNYLM